MKIVAFILAFLSAEFVLAQEVMEQTSSAFDLNGPATAIALGIAATGGALAQGKAISAALDGIARNPSAQDKIFTPMILGLAFIESLVIFTLLLQFI